MSDPNPALERRAAALAIVALYRAAFPGDARTDDQLLSAPYGGYECLDLPPDLVDTIPERLRRLSLAAVHGTPPDPSALVDAALGQVRGGIAALHSRLAELQARIAQGGALPGDIATLGALKAKFEAFHTADL